MKLIKMLSLIAIGVAAAMAFIGATSASATFPTQLCTEHVELECQDGAATTSVHQVLATGTVGKLLSSLVTVLCLGVLAEAGIGRFVSWGEIGGIKYIYGSAELDDPQTVQFTYLSFTGCGTGSTHNNCTVTTEELSVADLLKTGLDSGSLTLLNGRIRLECPNLGIDCKYDTAGSLFAASAGHLTVSKTPITELGGKFFCPDKGELDGLLETLVPAYILG